MARQSDFVITGMGVVCPVAVGIDAFQESLRTAASGIGPVQGFDASALDVRIGAEIKDFNPKEYVRPRKSLKVMARDIQVAFSAAVMATDQAGLGPGKIAPERWGVVQGCELISGDYYDTVDVYRNCLDEAGEFVYERWGERAMSDIYPLWMLKYLPNMPACHLGIANDAHGPNNSIAMGEVSSLLAFSEAINVLERGHVDAMLVGGGGNRLTLTKILWETTDDLSKQNDEPTATPRPFDADRDGFVNGEGAGSFVLERREHAESRGAEIIADVYRVSSTCGAVKGDRAPGPRVDTLIRAMRQALERADMQPEEIGFVSAHGHATVDGDIREAAAIADVFGDTPVYAGKGSLGNAGAGGGAVETVASIIGARNGWIPPTRNYEKPDPKCPVQVVHGEPKSLDKPAFLKLSYDLEGQAAAMVVSVA
jgi:3-oxoacyl-[acyl-carrier-protein] synthase II